MKSKLQERSLQTSCQECQFAIYDDDSRLGKVTSSRTQTGCKAGRLEKLQDYVIEAYNEENEFYIIDCLCNMFRQPSWNHGAKDVELARREIEPRFSVIVDAGHPTASRVKDIETTTESLLGIDYDHGKIAIVFSIGSHESKIIKQACLESFKKLQRSYRPQVVVSKNSAMADVESFKRALGCTYYINMLPGQKISSSLLRDIDYALNEDMVRSVFFSREGINVISFVVYCTRKADHATYREFESSIRIEAKKMGLYADI